MNPDDPPYDCVVLWNAKEVAMATGLPSQVNVIGDSYNILTGHTDGTQWRSGGLDTGIRVNHKVFQIETDSEFSQGVSYHPHDTCQGSHTIKIVFSPKSYQDKLLQRISFDGQQYSNLQATAFSLSNGYHYAKQETVDHHQVIIDKETTCITGSAHYKMSLAQADGHKLTHEVIVDICALPETRDDSAYKAFIDKWGTHVITEVQLGHRETQRYRMNAVDFLSYVMKKAPSDVSEGGPINGSVHTYKIDVDSFKTRISYSDFLSNIYNTLKTGSDASPEPMGLGLTFIDVAFSPQFWQRNWESYLYCPYNITSTVRVKRQLLQQALQQYALTLGGQSPQGVSLKVPITLPSGTYGIMKSTTGCPTYGSWMWKEGWRKQNTETQVPDSSWTSPNHFDASLNDTTFLMRFCVKTIDTDGLSMDWPKGDYCIFKYHMCPPGFAEGYVQWDDEDINNANALGGTLPSGDYGADTLMRYCCRSDGSVYEPIVLPTNKPFYLFQYKHGCQEVKYMTSSVEELVFDDEDSTASSSASIGSVHPGMRFCNPPKYPGCGSGSTIYYCYYRRSDGGIPTIVG